MRDVLALTWSEHRRTTELCAGLGVELIVLGTSHCAALRYLLLGARTIRQLMRRRPRVLLVPNPSLVLSALAVMVRAVLGYMLVVDAHNEAIAPFVHRQRWVKGLSRWVIRRADLTLVSNEQLTEQVVLQGGRPFALADRVPVPPPVTARALHGRFNVVLIATFAPDEPVAAVLEAVRSVDVELYVTGNERELDRAIAAKAPPNVRFTGFLAEADYWTLLRSADAIIDLTLMNNCLVCGAYEALALGKPMLLSKNAASVEFFGGCAVFTDNTVADIRAALERLKLEYARLQAAAEGRRSELMDQWIGSARELQDLLAKR
jgi:glycosyltransferase involved in cell wall biosynthesis